MPKTIIKKRTWGCVCLWNTDNPAWEGRDCPSCGKVRGVQRETNPARMGTLTIIGVEDVDEEVQERTEDTHRARRFAQGDAEIARREAAGEFPTLAAKELALTNYRSAVERNIARLKQQEATGQNGPTFRPAGYFLTTLAEVVAYRTARQGNITAAIAKAKLVEEVV